MTTFKMQAKASKKYVDEFMRDTSDNKILSAIQVKNIEDYIDENTIFVWDFDGVPFKASATVEENYIIIKEKDTGKTWELESRTEFKGRVKKGYAATSWIGVENVKREADGLVLWTVDDFEIEDHKRLKKNQGFEQVKDNIKDYISACTGQFCIKNLKLVIGSGDCFRHELPFPVGDNPEKSGYKGNRADSAKPLLLKEAREWVTKEYDTEIAVEGYETDDVVEWYAAKGYMDYLKTGKFSYVILSEDKDSGSNPKMWCLYTKEGPKFPNPQPVLIESSSRNIGILELVQMSNSTELKGTGFVWLCAQAFGVGDSADNYHPYLRFPKEIKEGIKYGKTEFYKEFINLKTPKEVLQKCVDNMFLWFPKGIKYLDVHGVKQDVDTLSWMQTCFAAAYMTRKQGDKTCLKDLLDGFKVDYQKIVDNNKEKILPFKEDEDLRLTIKDIRESIEEIAKVDFKKSDKKDVLVEKLEEKCGKLEQVVLSFDNLYQ